MRGRLFVPETQKYVCGYLVKVTDELRCIFIGDDGVNYLLYPVSLFDKF